VAVVKILKKSAVLVIMALLCLKLLAFATGVISVMGRHTALAAIIETWRILMKVAGQDLHFTMMVCGLKIKLMVTIVLGKEP
jgi:hypothetical protein